MHFAADETTQTFTVTAVDDTADEDSESVTLTFGAPLPAGVTPDSPSETTVTLTDNDPDPGVPSILTVELTSEPGSDGLYVIDDEIEASVRFNKTVTVTGEPQLGLIVGDITRTAIYRDSAGEVVRFVYTVAAGDRDTDGFRIAANSLLLNDGTIRDSANDATISHEAVADDPDHLVDAVLPALDEVHVRRTALTLTYNKPLDEDAVPAPRAFTVAVDGVAHSVTAVEVRGNAVTLTLSAVVAYGEEGVTVSYTPGSPPLRDLLGNQAEAVLRPDRDERSPALRH